MATQTDHMKLTKPAYTDSADIAVINSNMDAIDTATSKILPVISGTTNNSGYTIASGEYFEANGKLYKANASIPTNQAWSSSATEQSDNGAINALNGKISNQVNIGTNNEITSTPITSGTFQTLATITGVSLGDYLVIVDMNFAAGTGNRILLVDTYETNSNNSINSVLAEGRATLQKIRPFRLSPTDTIYMRAYQNSGSDMNVGGNYRLVKISD